MLAFLILSQTAKDPRLMDVDSNMKVISEFKTPMPSFGIDIYGNTAYLSSFKKIYAVDFEELENPALFSEINIKGFPIGVMRKGNYLFCASGYSGLVVVDVSDPFTAEQVASVASRDSAVHLDIKGNYLFLADGEGGIAVYNISNPRNPKLVSYYDTEGFARGVHVHGNRLYVADGTNGLVILDISNVRKIRKISSYKLADTIFAISVKYYRGKVYLATGKSGVYVFDVSNVKQPRPIIRYTGPGEALGLFLKGNLLYLAYGKGGVRIIDLVKVEREIAQGRKVITRAEVAKFIHAYYKGHVIYDLVADGRYVYAVSRKGLVIYEYTY